MAADARWRLHDGRLRGNARRGQQLAAALSDWHFFVVVYEVGWNKR